jgi:hypothetical protein
MYEKSGETLVTGERSEVTDISQLIEGLDEQLVDYTDSARKMREATRQILSEESLLDYARVYCPDFDQNDRLNRGRENQIKRAVTDSVKLMILNAKLWAQIYADPNCPEDKKAEADKYRRESETPKAEDDPFKTVLDAAWSRIFDTEVERAKNEHAVRGSIENFLAAPESNVVQFIETILASDPEEYRELLAVLYKDREDTVVTSLVGNAVRDTDTHPEIFMNSFLDIVDSISADTTNEEDSVTAESRSWLGWIASSSLITVPIASLLRNQPPAEWPESLRSALEAHSHGQMKRLWDAYTDLTNQHANKAIFTVQIDHVSAIQDRALGKTASSSKAKKRGSPKGSRSTSKVSADTYLDSSEKEEKRIFESVATVAKTPAGWIVQDEHELGAEPISESILEIPLIGKYLAKYAGDPDIRHDMIAMLESIFREPHYNGASKLVHQSVNIQHGSQAHEKPVWHLNPNKRSGLNVGVVGRKTRIFYAMHPDRERRQVLLLDISHKNGAESLANTSFRRTS